MPDAKIINGSPCPNVSFYGRACTLPAHGWHQPCRFRGDADEDYDLTDGSTLKDLLEALTAGGMVAVSAAMRWIEYRLGSDAREASRLFGPSSQITHDRESAVIRVEGEREIVMRYLTDRAAQASLADPPADQTSEANG